MRRVRASVEIDASIDVVWRLISEFGYWPQWGPTVTAVRSAADEVAPGVEGSVRTPVGLWVPFRVTTVKPGVSWCWRIGGIEATGHQVTEHSDGSSALAFSVPWYFAPYQLVLRAALRRIKKIAETPRIESTIMADQNGIEALVRSLKETARAHHEATGGVNPQWSDWYAERLVEDVNRHTNSERTVEELSAWLAEADRRYRTDDPEMSWPRAYAAWLIGDE